MYKLNNKLMCVHATTTLRCTMPLKFKLCIQTYVIKSADEGIVEPLGAFDWVGAAISQQRSQLVTQLLGLTRTAIPLK